MVSFRKEAARDSVAAFGLVSAWAGGFILLALLIWGLFVLIAPLTGSGDVRRHQNDARNREHWSTTYNGEYAQLLADTNQVALLAASYNDTHSEKDRVDLNGAQLNCQQDVARYNADANDLLGRQWLPAGLPTSADASKICAAPTAPSHQ